MSEDASSHGFGTRAIHDGRDGDYASTPIHMASTGKHGYTRGGNPSIKALEQSMASLEGARYCTAAACGMAAVTQTLLALLKAGDRVVCHRCVYDWTDTFMLEELPRFGVEVVQADLRDRAALEAALAKPARLVHFEPLSNPGLDVIDPAAVIAAAHQAGALAVVDNSFLTPALFRPLEAGADVVVHTATKFLCGHGDAMGGIVATNNPDVHSALRRARNIYGGVISPFNAFLILRGISTLPLRMARHCENAMTVARFLSGHRAVAQVRYPGLPGDGGHATARRFLKDFGGVAGFVMAGGGEAAGKFAAALKLCKPWVSLGDVETLIQCRATEPRKGIPEGYVRLSVGLEDANDIIADLDQALGQSA